ncbi:ABC transporter permease [Falsiroseomonas sp. HW251]|uniref:ABC transporter permease n=1 Tax=Falsiroseomonas sp. HW251 TaxID=3390998 RepID=UPI003D3178BD
MSATHGTALLPRLLESLGAPPRRGLQVALAAAALALGVVAEGARPSTWRHPTVRAEFRRELRLALLGGLLTVLVTGVLVGLGAVYQAISWLSFLGQEGLAGRILVTVLVRETAPILVGLILLGRSGTVTVVEFGAIKAAGQLRLLEAQGIDPFTLLVLPRVLALAVAGFTLGVIFLAVTLGTGWLAAEFLGLLRTSQVGFFENVIAATERRDFAILAAKLTLIGALVALMSAITGMSATARDTPSYLLPRGFVRGLTAVLVTSFVLTVTLT